MECGKPLVIVENVSKSYPAPGSRREVLRNISFCLEAGEALVITGPSGSGKSTLLHLLAGLCAPDSGRIEVAGEAVNEMSAQAAAAYRRQRVGLVFQEHHLLPACTALENTLVPALPAGKGRELLPRAEALLAKMGLAHLAQAFPATMSGGERQRLALARALINSPCLLLADEPTGQLDRACEESIAALLQEIVQSENTALVLVTHNLRLAGKFPRVRELRDGCLQ
ncbi:MAG: ABC transporter ATP-binding protein [Planctomycetota bacterium]|nr:ABC transporter ATP-binding protein [Planctomycetota bacterium]